MPKDDFLPVAATSDCENWEQLITREGPLYDRKGGDIRTEFGRDYTRILHSLAYRRLKHKTQVFFNTQNDHVCTRMEHVSHVESVSYTIAKYLGLNTELTKAIAVGHDLGHPPFGHQGEIVLNELSKQNLEVPFWHEKHGLYCVDNIELLIDQDGELDNLHLTYAVRDGIISHCGEMNQKSLSPRKEIIDLHSFDYSGQYQPYTWEACVVKISDKIAYIGRDIEDAFTLNFIGRPEIREMIKLARKYGFNTLNTTVFIHELITDLCNNSTPDKGLIISEKNMELMDVLKDYNYKYIYNNKKFIPYKNYIKLVITSIFEVLYDLYDAENTISKLKYLKSNYPELTKEFIKWLRLYTNIDEKRHGIKHKKLYGQLETKKAYAKAIIDFIAGMTDQYAIKTFNELTKY